MKCQDVYFALSKIRDKDNKLSEEKVLFHIENGMLESLPGKDFLRFQKDGEDVDDLSSQLGKLSVKIAALEKEKKEYNEKLLSPSYQIFKKKSLPGLRSSIYKLEQSISEKTITLSELENKIKTKKESLSKIEGMILLGGVAVKMTEKGKNVLKDLGCRIERVGHLEYDSFHKDIEGIRKIITNQVDRLRDFNKELSSKYGSSSKTFEAAKELAKQSGDKERLLERLSLVYEILKGRSWDSSKALPLVALLISIPGEPREITKIVINIFEQFKREEYTEDYKTARASVLGMQNEYTNYPSLFVGSVDVCFQKMKELSDWEYTSKNAPLATQLSLVKEGAERTNEIYRYLLVKKWPSGYKTKVLAYIFAFEDDYKKMAERTKELYKKVNKSNSTSLKDNVAFGIMAMLPMEIDEIFELYNFTKKELKDKKCFQDNRTVSSVLFSLFYSREHIGRFVYYGSQSHQERIKNLDRIGSGGYFAKKNIEFSLGHL